MTDESSSPCSVAPSQTLPDHLQDPLKFSPRSVTTLDEEDEDSPVASPDWDRTLRPVGLDQAAHTISRSVAHSRESSLEKLSGSTSSLASPRTLAGQQRQGIGAVFERSVDPKSASYGHHRQTSIVHGIQHSRNGSLASSSSSPLSPQMIAAAGAGLAPERPEIHAVARLEGDPVNTSRPPTSLAGSVAGLETATLDNPGHAITQKKVERMHSKSRREHASGHHHSHSSRHHKDDQQKTVGEYALHVLFTSVRMPRVHHAGPPLS